MEALTRGPLPAPTTITTACRCPKRGCCVDQRGVHRPLVAAVLGVVPLKGLVGLGLEIVLQRLQGCLHAPVMLC